jgi:hypothetical protein
MCDDPGMASDDVNGPGLIGVIGGSGPAGSALAARLASVGFRVMIGPARSTARWKPAITMSTSTQSSPTH